MFSWKVAGKMDELTAALAVSFEISSEPNKTSAPHPRFTQFKCKSSNSDQDSRRRHLLEIQKKNRFDFLNHVRKLTEDDWKADKEEEETIEEGDMEIEIKKPGRHYQDQLMMSEWLVEVPADLAEEWVMVLCPVGRRTLIVTNGFSTKAYSRSGHFLRSFPSLLPGGNRKQNKKGQKQCTVLDCVYNEVDKTYFVLDLMCWRGHSIYETESEFRFYWLQEKLAEVGGLGEISNLNPVKFVPLPNFPCTPDSISTSIAAAHFEIDGLLFYHKRTHYLFGSSPLVVWLKPYMVPEMLGVAVPDEQLVHRPATYTNYADHMQQVGDDKTQDTKATKRDYKAYGVQKKPRKKRDQEMADDSREEDTGAGGEGPGDGMSGARVRTEANGDSAVRATVLSLNDGGVGDMESESLHK